MLNFSKIFNRQQSRAHHIDSSHFSPFGYAIKFSYDFSPCDRNILNMYIILKCCLLPELPKREYIYPMGIVALGWGISLGRPQEQFTDLASAWVFFLRKLVRRVCAHIRRDREGERDGDKCTCIHEAFDLLCKSKIECAAACKQATLFELSSVQLQSEHLTCHLFSFSLSVTFFILFCELFCCLWHRKRTKQFGSCRKRSNRKKSATTTTTCRTFVCLHWELSVYLWGENLLYTQAHRGTHMCMFVWRMFSLCVCVCAQFA